MTEPTALLTEESSLGLATVERVARELAERSPSGWRRSRRVATLAALRPFRAWLKEIRPVLLSIERSSPDASAAEWFLDNDYRLIRAARQVEEDMPPGFYARLAGWEDGLPRVHTIARELLRTTELLPDRAAIVRFVEVFGERAPLSTAELWALPAFLRFCVLEDVAEALGSLTRLPPPLRSDRSPPGRGLDPGERLSRGVRTLRTIDAISWLRFFDATSALERTLREDPSGVYARQDFDTRDRYRSVVEELAWRVRSDEVAVARVALGLAERERARHGRRDRRAHVGYFLVDAGLPALEQAVGARPPAAERLRRALSGRPGASYVGGALLATTLALLAVLAVTDGASEFERSLAMLLALLPASAFAIAAWNHMLCRLFEPRVLPKLDARRGLPPDSRTLLVVPTLLASPADGREMVRRLERHHLVAEDPQLDLALLADFTDADREHLSEDDAIVAAARDAIRALNDAEERRTGRRPFHLLMRPRRWNPCEGVWMGWERKRGKLEGLLDRLAGHGDGGFHVHEGDPKGLEGVRFVLTLDSDTVLPRGSAARLVATLAHPLNRPVRDPKTGRITAGYSVIQPRLAILPSMEGETWFQRIFSTDASVDLYSHAVSDVYQDLAGEGIYAGKGLIDVLAFRESLQDRVPENALLSHDLFEGVHGRAALANDILLYEDYPPNSLAHSRREHRWIRGDWHLLPWLVRRTPRRGGQKAPSGLSLLDRWKIFDNLRRSLVPPALLALLIAGWLGLAGGAVAWTLLVLLAPAFPLGPGMIDALRRLPREGVFALREFGFDLARLLLRFVFLPHEAANHLDAIGRTLHRVFHSRRHMLEWRTAAATAQQLARSRRAQLWSELAVAPALAGLLAVGLATGRPAALSCAAPFLVAWALAPEVALFLGRRPRRRREELRPEEHRYLRRGARRIWLFFETFVGPEDQWLPPDNFQEDPLGTVAHRTSPTNIGMCLVSTVCARDLGHLTLSEATQRLENILESVQRLEHYRGHLLNWYETLSSRPLEPRYVSTVDSGNLAASLIVVRQAAREWIEGPLAEPALREGLEDAVDLLEEALDRAGVLPGDREAREALDILRRLVADPGAHPAERVVRLTKGVRRAEEQLAAALVRILHDDRVLDPAGLVEGRIWLERVRHQVLAWIRQLEELHPAAVLAARAPAGLAEELARFPALLEGPPSLSRAADHAAEQRAALERLMASAQGEGVEFLQRLTAAVDRGLERAQELRGRLGRLAQLAESEFAGMDFSLLYDESRELFRIGYEVGEQRPDPNHYDLLASEARLASLLAIAKGHVPQRHWQHLGRPLTRLRGRLALLSWGGTMFEYLMPPLFAREGEGSLLGASAWTAVRRQMRYARRRGVPWGISEAAYALLDAGRVYQYRAFGVPGLGFKRGLADDLVIAPYASILAVGLRPRSVVRNLERFDRLGARGTYGWIESVDFTPERMTGGPVLVRTYMAHHQGMAHVAIAGLLCGGATQRRFHADPRVSTVELLLAEEFPRGGPLERPHDDPLPHQAPAPLAEVGAVAWRGFVDAPVPDLTVLAGGRLSSVVTASGSGWLARDGIDLTARTLDPTRETPGAWIYLRDSDSGALWSVGRKPIPPQEGEARVEFHANEVTLFRREHELAVRVRVGVAPDEDVELRYVSIRNESDRERRITVTSYAEVALSRPQAREGHPAFDKIFVVSDLDEESGTLLFERRKREGEQDVPVLAHRLVGHGRVRLAGFESAREEFLGRGGDERAPEALVGTGRRRETLGPVLDPVMSLSAEVVIPAHGRTNLAFVTACGRTRREALQAALQHNSLEALEVIFEAARTRAGRELMRIGLRPDRFPAAMRLLSAALFPCSALRPPGESLARGIGPRSGLWGLGISGDLPLVVARVSDVERRNSLRELLRAHRLWRERGVSVDLVLLRTDASSYDDEVAGSLRRILSDEGAEAWLGRRGGVYVLRGDQLPPGERERLEALASVVLSIGGERLDELIAPLLRPEPRLPRFTPTPHAAPEPFPTESLSRPTGLILDCGYGGFTPDGSGYVIHLEPGRATPAPWSNVLANERFGVLTTERGIGYAWFENSGEGRLLPWRCDPVLDEPVQVVYMRDEETGNLWSATPAPCPGGSAYTVEHRPGRTEWRTRAEGIESDLVVAVAARDPVQISRLTLRNRTDRVRRITVTCYVEWGFGPVASRSRAYTVSRYDDQLRALFARCDAVEDGVGRTAFLATPQVVHGYTADRREFLGKHGSLSRPASLERIGLADRDGTGLDPCAALTVHVDLPANGTGEVVFLLGAERDEQKARRLAARFREEETRRNALREAREGWERVLGTLRPRTPDPALNALVGCWLPYQALSYRILGRTGFYQSSGAFGFRDQLQDVLALLWAAPERAREHLLRAASMQFEEGDVLHWWHPPAARGVRTRCSDDLAWLPFVLARYVQATGDARILTEEVPFLSAEPLRDEEHDRYARFEHGARRGTMLEHARRALERAFTQGPHGLPKIGDGDWNDGMNALGRRGRGESVWLGWFLVCGARSLADLERRAGRSDEAVRWRVRADELARRIEQVAWDGRWYLRAFDDDGRPVGSSSAEECRIDSIAQSWAVLSGAGDPQRARLALEEATGQLVDEEAGIVRLLRPPFDRGSIDPGYLRAYPPGVRENGGQYTHAAVWLAWAWALAGDADRAWRLVRMLLPTTHARDAEHATRYRLEPYLVAADVYAEPPHIGRGGWSGYTGAAAWLMRLVVEALLGLELREGELVVNPRPPADWSGYQVDLDVAGVLLTVEVRRETEPGAAALQVELDGTPLREPRVALRALTGRHHLLVRCAWGCGEEQPE